uniref:Uncharacterized protein n=1 Tax=Anopheles albimanus TaxID=7167 RepID=A0A182F5T7_ANOAL
MKLVFTEVGCALRLLLLLLVAGGEGVLGEAALGNYYKEVVREQHEAINEMNQNFTELERASEKLIDLGYHVAKHTVPPKTIKITNTVAVKVPVPFPVKVPEPVPVPVPVDKPIPIPVPTLVAVPVDATAPTAPTATATVPVQADADVAASSQRQAAHGPAVPGQEVQDTSNSTTSTTTTNSTTSSSITASIIQRRRDHFRPQRRKGRSKVPRRTITERELEDPDSLEQQLQQQQQQQPDSDSTMLVVKIKPLRLRLHTLELLSRMRTSRQVRPNRMVPSGTPPSGATNTTRPVPRIRRIPLRHSTEHRARPRRHRHRPAPRVRQATIEEAEEDNLMEASSLEQVELALEREGEKRVMLASGTSGRSVSLTTAATPPKSDSREVKPRKYGSTGKTKRYKLKEKAKDKDKAQKQKQKKKKKLLEEATPWEPTPTVPAYKLRARSKLFANRTRTTKSPTLPTITTSTSTSTTTTTTTTTTVAPAPEEEDEEEENSAEESAEESSEESAEEQRPQPAASSLKATIIHPSVDREEYPVEMLPPPPPPPVHTVTRYRGDGPPISARRYPPRATIIRIQLIRSRGKKHIRIFVIKPSTTSTTTLLPELSTEATKDDPHLTRGQLKPHPPPSAASSGGPTGATAQFGSRFRSGSAKESTAGQHHHHHHHHHHHKAASHYHTYTEHRPTGTGYTGAKLDEKYKAGGFGSGSITSVPSDHHLYPNYGTGGAEYDHGEHATAAKLQFHYHNVHPYGTGHGDNGQQQQHQQQHQSNGIGASGGGAASEHHYYHAEPEPTTFTGQLTSYDPPASGGTTYHHFHESASASDLLPGASEVHEQLAEDAVVLPSSSSYTDTM